jgi:hypothetical protein
MICPAERPAFQQSLLAYLDQPENVIFMNLVFFKDMTAKNGAKEPSCPFCRSMV